MRASCRWPRPVRWHQRYQSNQRPTALGQLAGLCRDALAKGDGRLDLKTVEDLLTKLNPASRAQAFYFAGRFLQQRGHVPEARQYLERCLQNPQVGQTTLALAACALRDLKSPDKNSAK